MTVGLRTREIGQRWPRAAHFLFGGAYFQMRKHIEAVAPAVTAGLGAEWLANGNFAAWTADNPDNWSVATEDANNYVTQAVGQARLVSNAQYGGITQGTLTDGVWYQVSFDLNTIVSGGVIVSQATFRNVGTYTTTGTKTLTMRCGAAVGFQLQSNGAGDVTFDNASVKALTLTTLLSGGGDAGSRYGLFDADVTVAAAYQAGLMCCLDSAANPLWYLHAFVDRATDQAVLVRVANGAATELIAAAATYSAAGTLRVMIVPGSNGLSNAQVRLYYKGAQVGATQTVDLSSGYGTLVRGFDTSAAATVKVRAYGRM